MDGKKRGEEEGRKVEMFWAWEFFVLSERGLAYPAAAIASTANLFAVTGPRRPPGAQTLTMMARLRSASHQLSREYGEFVPLDGLLLRFVRLPP